MSEVIKPLNKEQAAIVSAYTGFLVGSFSGLHEYVEKLLGRPIWTHQFPDLADEIKEKSKQDFIALSGVKK